MLCTGQVQRLVPTGVKAERRPLTADYSAIQFKRLLSLRVTACACLLFLAACSTRAPQRSESGAPLEQDLTQDREQLVEIARQLIGVPYRYGGSEPDDGFDCSGLVFYSYRRGGVSVPRTAAQQRRHALPVSAAELLPGDLDFFATRAKGGHVGIYSGNGRFIHAPSSGGRVREEQLNNAYWRTRWLGGGNLLDALDMRSSSSLPVAQSPVPVDTAGLSARSP